ncbi:hypothetical protein GCM10010435_23030 [Winogradskya consettensis]|uniref:Uncharacterized protein n=1 Tax=Winogradskya consettensis TaxID=113560 RepID=A0A919W6G2_9ACTN|nr:hypothetical protein [Actinoplanes consettensis]GIM83338.1 hypothetical protein Aco04nite_86040 [Actinoplanes consettensis]
MLEPVVDARVISTLAEALIGRAGESVAWGERDLFRPLARAYFRDRARALGGAGVPFTTLMLEAARVIADRLVEEALRPGGPGLSGLDSGAAGPGWLLRGDARTHRVIVEVLTGAGGWAPDRAFRLADLITGPVMRGGAFRLGDAA